MTDKKLLGSPDADSARLLRTALRLLATGDPITPGQLAAAAEVPLSVIERGAGSQDIEYDDQGRIIGWGLTRNPTPHKFTVNGVALYTWCAPDTLIFPALIGATAHVESPCLATGTTIRLTVDPDDKGVTSVDPAAAVVSVVDPAQVDPDAMRATLCSPQHFFVNADAARDWQSRHPGMTVLPVADAYRQLARPLAEALLRGRRPELQERTWSRPTEAAAMLLRGHTARVASPTALVVGTILSAVNQVDVIAGGEATVGTWVRVAFNYAVPFVVASLGYLAAHHVHADEH